MAPFLSPYPTPQSYLYPYLHPSAPQVQAYGQLPPQPYPPPPPATLAPQVPLQNQSAFQGSTTVSPQPLPVTASTGFPEATGSEVQPTSPNVADGNNSSARGARGGRGRGSRGGGKRGRGGAPLAAESAAPPSTSSALANVGVPGPSTSSGSTVNPTPPTPRPLDVTTAATVGAGPTTNPPTPTLFVTPPANTSQPDRPFRSSTSATDIWYFIRPLDSEKAPDVLPGPDEPPRIYSRPKSKFAGCRLCKTWQVWRMGNINNNLRVHLSTRHSIEWSEEVRRLSLKIQAPSRQATPVSDPTNAPPPLRPDELVNLLVEWVTADDQAIRSVEVPEFRKLLLGLGRSYGLQDKDIPHRTKITKAILERYKKEKELTKQRVKASVGRVSLTSDLWSDDQLQSYMAVSGHYCAHGLNGELTLKTEILAFRNITCGHTGAELASEMMKVLDSYEIAHKLGSITLDNASNNNTLMTAAGRLLSEQGIDFEADGNRIRCFPHVINIAVEAILKELARGPPTVFVTEDSDQGIVVAQDLDQGIIAALQRDIVSICRSIVIFCRASGSRRTGLRQVIVEGNAAGWFGQGVRIPEHQLLRDVPTRWSSTFFMIDRFLELWPAIKWFILRSGQLKDCADMILQEKEIAALRDIQQILEIPHTAQEALSAEKTPTLSLTLPLYEDMIESLRLLKKTIPEMAYAMDAGIAKLNEYVLRARKSRIHALSMILNPSVKLQFIQDNWTEEEAKQAKIWMEDVMVAYYKSNLVRSVPADSTGKSCSRSGTDSPATLPSSAGAGPSRNPQRRSSGYLKLRTDPSFRRSVSPGLTNDASPHPSPTIQSIGLPAEDSRRASLSEQEQETMHRAVVQVELHNYLEAQDREIDSGASDLLQYWKYNAFRYPTMYRVALDILPTQASSVCCERLFSSSKETVTKRRNKLAPALVEAIQHLKFVFRGDRNSFIEANATEPEIATHTMLAELSDTPLAAEDVKDLMEKGDDAGLDAALAKIELFEAWDARNHGVQRHSEPTGSTEDQ